MPSSKIKFVPEGWRISLGNPVCPPSIKFIDMTDINTYKLIYIGKVRKDLHLNSLIN